MTMVTIQCSLGESLGLVAPYYNLVLVVIVVILFLRLFSCKKSSMYIKPWHFLFFSLIVFVVEEIITVLEGAKLIDAAAIIFPLLETIIITSFIYMLLLQKNYLKSLK